ncbi:isoprenoid synthase domain-containing protein [Bipolaris maydis]|uniref:isoprenoid synthase domain-containing protein n=1 Tax=Cochliobolus heterostrophus TaxID=5016 RepID=UPI0024DB1F7F|nr:isoprenoid synthase domain-containing protein [Bipolaris maydis]KAJ6197995.1 isoprenoid synthase domain-containing protein [Bipolaris maydis]KAJ6272331.1 isoprenoid synthase domain-containing protein [Bipolaris maydis]
MPISSISGSWTLVFKSYVRQLVKSLYTAKCTEVQKQDLSVAQNEPVKHGDHRAQIIARLRGQEIHVPDVHYIYSGWEANLHPDVELSRQHLERYFETFISTESVRKKQRKVDNALCAGQFWPRVSSDKFLVLGELVAWFFFWDDEIDCGTLTDDSDKTEAYCDDTLNFIRHCLQPELEGDVPAPGRLHNCGPWVNMGRAMQEGQSKEARDRFAAAIYDFVMGVRVSQATWTRGMSTLEDYTARRLRTVGTNPCVAVIQWAYGLTLPPSVWDHEAMVSITREVAISDFLWNDIVSLRKEIDDGDIDSAIPVMVWNEGCSAQSAVDRCVKMVEESWERLQEAEKKLMAAHAGDSKDLRDEIETLVGGCKDLIVGHMVYSLKIPRNMSAANMSDKDCSFRIVL